LHPENVVKFQILPLAALSLLSFLPAAYAQTSSNSVDYKTPHKKVEDLPNFHMVHPFLYRGGEPSKKGLQQLKEKGVKNADRPARQQCHN
jgi:hypothetical protein